MFNKISNHINSLLAFFASNFSKMFSRNSNKRKTPILKGLSILVVLLVTIFLFFKFNGFGPKSFSAYINDKFAVLGIGTNFPHDVIGTKIDKKNFSSMNNCLCYVSDSNFASMNSTNKNLINEKHNFSTPILKSSKNFSIVYNLYGTAARIFSKTKEVLEFNTEKNILCAAVSDCGTFGVVTEAKGYFCKLEAFKDLNREKKCFSYSFSDVYITEIAFADNGKSLAVVGVGSKDGTFLI